MRRIGNWLVNASKKLGTHCRLKHAGSAPKGQDPEE